MPNTKKPRLGEPGYAASQKRKRRVIEGMLDQRKVEAAILLAEGRYTITAICKKVGVSHQALDQWRLHDELFKKRVETEIEIYRDRVMRKAIARKECRIDILQDTLDRLTQVIEGRAEEHQDAPGGASGLLARTVKGLGSGDNFSEVEEYEFDSSLVTQLRGILRDAAEELGQISSKNELSGPGGIPLAPPQINIQFVAVNGKTETVLNGT